MRDPLTAPLRDDVCGLLVTLLAPIVAPLIIDLANYLDRVLDA